MPSSETIVTSELIDWAIDRSQLTDERIAKSLNTSVERLHAWRSGGARPTFRQLQKLASTTHVPLGLLFLEEPPAPILPIPDFRTIDGSAPAELSTELVDCIQSVQRKSEWFHQFRIEHGQETLAWIEYTTTDSSTLEVAESIARTLDVASIRSEARDNEQFLDGLMRAAELVGISVIRTSIVGSNTHRPLDVSEFRGFSVFDDLAPFVFINGADARAAQIFTLAHEFAHLWRSESGISNATGVETSRSPAKERFCNQVAAELLLPKTQFLALWDPGESVTHLLARIAHTHKVSQIVVAIRAHELELMSRSSLASFYASERERWASQPAPTGGNHWNNIPIRNGRVFTQAVIDASRDLSLLTRDAASLLGVSPASVYKLHHGESGE